MPKKPVTNVGGSRQAVRTDSVNSLRLVISVMRAATSSSNSRARSCSEPTIIPLIDIIGVAGAALTTLCWLPQALKVIRERETGALSLLATAGFMVGVAFRLIYGLAIGNWPLIGSDAITLALMLPILATKLRYG